MAQYTKYFTGYDTGNGLNRSPSVSLSSGSGTFGNSVVSARVDLYLSANGDGPFPVAVTIDGVASGSANLSYGGSGYTGKTFSISISSGLSSINWSASSHTLVISCSKDGGKIFTKGNQQLVVESNQVDSGGGDSGSSGGSSSGSSVAASSVSLSNTSLTVGSTVKCIISPMGNYGQTHVVRWSINNTTVRTVNLSSGTLEDSLTIVASHMAYINTSVNGILTCNVQTYKDGSLMGYAATSGTITVPSSYVPSFNIALNPSNLKMENYIVSVTKPGVNITDIAAGSYANLVSYSVSCTGMNMYYVSPFNNSSTSFTYSSPCNSVGTNRLTVTVTDSRGRSTSKYLEFSVKSYNPPVVSKYDTYRCNKNGYASDSGEYLYATITYSIGRNTISGITIDDISVYYKNTNETSYRKLSSSSPRNTSGTVNFSALGYGVFSSLNTYDIMLSITDSYGSTIYMYDKIFPYSEKLFTIDGVNGHRTVCVGQDRDLTKNNAFVINPSWEAYYKGETLDQRFILVSDLNSTSIASVRTMFYGDSEPSSPVAGMIWLKPAEA